VKPRWASNSFPALTTTTTTNQIQTTTTSSLSINKFKYIVLGDCGVGKSCILMRLIDGEFRDMHDMTIGVEFGAYSYLANDGCRINLQIWDTAGQEQFRSITRSYYRNTSAAVLVYDVSNRASFVHLLSWLDECRQYVGSGVLVIILGNKCDLDNDARQVSFEEGEAFAQEHNVLFMESSAKTNKNIEEAFIQTSKVLYEKSKNNNPS
jgi:small GTP-binding protein